MEWVESGTWEKRFKFLLNWKVKHGANRMERIESESFIY